MATDRPARTVLRCWGFFDWLCRVWIIITHQRKGGDDCVYFPERVINRPDPCIYSQFLLMQLKQPVTWDNPDVAIFKGGVEQYTYGLTVDTQYDVAVTVHNTSLEKAALGTKVSVRWIEFGAGGLVRHPIDELVANVGVYPATAVVATTWRTPATPGHYCIEVQLAHPNDGNPANNLGWNNTQVLAAHSEARTPVRIFNRHVGAPRREEQAVHRGPPWNLVEIEFDSYVFNDAYGAHANGDVMFAPRPPAWPARVEPRTFHFAPGETYRDVDLIVDAPAGPGHPEKFNVTARQGGAPLGGVTVTVTRGA
ncbi:MAG: hypothetical protein JWM87_204 [Candidatus Eremiobacteraeota bacterium]|nr:hypothetical protein [Candidatus Eremiobacteraeota bacterium]